MSRASRIYTLALLITTASLPGLADARAQAPGPEDLVRSGRAWADQLNYERAIADYDEAIRLNPNYAPAYQNRGYAWGEKSEHDKAIADYDEAIRLDPRDASNYSSRGYEWHIKGEHDKAIADYDEAIRLNPNDALAYTNRGEAWVDKKEYDKAIADFTEVIRLDPKAAGGFHDRGYAWHLKGEYDKAIADYDQAIRLDPRDALAYTNRGVARLEKKEYDQAIADYGQAIRLKPEDAEGYYNRGLAYWMILRDGEAISGMRDVLEKGGWKSEFAAKATILGHLAAIRSGKPDEARKFLDEFLVRGDLTGWPESLVRYLHGKLNEADLLEASTDIGKLTASHAYLGIDLLLKKKLDEAKAHFLWVKEHGNPEYIEYMLSLAELDRLEKAEGAGGKP